MSLRTLTLSGLVAVATMLVLGACESAWASESAPDAGRAFDPRPLSQPLYDVSPPKFRERQFEWIEASDGIRLYLETWLPKAKPGGPEPPDQIPTVLIYTPYEQPDYNPPGYTSAVMVDSLVPRGYALSRLHVRGTGGSDGCVEVFSGQEADDGARAVEWLGRDAPWSDGNVGAIGLSYFGTSPLAVSARGDRARVKYLKAQVIAAPVGSAAELAAPDGVPQLLRKPIEQAYYDNRGYFPGWSLLNLLFGEVGPEGFLESRTQPGGTPAPLQSLERPRCRPVGLANAVDSSGDYTEFDADRDIKPYAERIRAATLMVHGTSDDNVQTLHQAGLFDRIARSTPKAGVFGVWAHNWPHEHPLRSEWERPNFLSDAAAAWFDRYLKGLNTGAWPAVQVQGTDGQWRTERDWPSTGGPPGQLVLGADGRLGVEQPTGSSSYREGGFEDAENTSDPEDELGLDERDGPAPGTFARWSTRPLPDRLQMSGMPVLDTWVVLDRDDAHLAARIETFDAAGDRIPGGRVHGYRSMRHLDPMPNGYFEQRHGGAAPVHRPVPVRVRFNPTDLVIPKGGRVELTLAGSLAREVGVGDGFVNWPTQPAGSFTGVTILHDCAHMSALRFLLPSPDGELLNVREVDEGDAPLANAPQKFGTTPVDGGGIARKSVCGSPPERLSEQQTADSRSTTTGRQ
jgi:predicted acyl esterase